MCRIELSVVDLGWVRTYVPHEGQPGGAAGRKWSAGHPKPYHGGLIPRGLNHYDSVMGQSPNPGGLWVVIVYYAPVLSCTRTRCTQLCTYIVDASVDGLKWAQPLQELLALCHHWD